MVPNNKLITITDNKNKIVKLLDELVLQPRLKALEWSKITKQTPNMKIGYPGQHLASLITGIEGVRIGARGDDLKDGTEVKSCSRVDQLDTCNYCSNKVLRIETTCPQCESTNIKKMDDSKWLFSVKSEAELNLLTQQVERIFLTIADYPKFTSNDFSIIRFQAFEIWNNVERHQHFKSIMTNYYNKLFLEHIKLKASKTPAPKNFWPFSYQFYLCNPVKVFNCTVINANSNPSIQIDHYVEPYVDRATLISEPMPTALLLPEEIKEIFKKVPESTMYNHLANGYTYSDVDVALAGKKIDRNFILSALPYIDESMRNILKLRDTDIISVNKTEYARRK